MSEIDKSGTLQGQYITKLAELMSTFQPDDVNDDAKTLATASPIAAQIIDITLTNREVAKINKHNIIAMMQHQTYSTKTYAPFYTETGDNVMHITGRTAAGASLCISVKGFRSWIYVVLPDNVASPQCENWTPTAQEKGFSDIVGQACLLWWGADGQPLKQTTRAQQPVIWSLERRQQAYGWKS